MKKLDIKKLALLGIAGGSLLAAQVQAGPAPHNHNLNNNGTTLSGGNGGCGGNSCGNNGCGNKKGKKGDDHGDDMQNPDDMNSYKHKKGDGYHDRFQNRSMKNKRSNLQGRHAKPFTGNNGSISQTRNYR